jgi:hypothetical protein
MELAYHPDFGGLVNYTFEQMPEDPDAQVSMACDRIIRMVLEDSESDVIQRYAAYALELGGGDPLTGVWLAVKPHIRFRQDFDIAADLQVDDSRKDSIVETFIRPADQAMLIEARGAGVEDCDGFTQFVACLLIALGVPCSLCVVAVDQEQPDRFSHIYVVAYPNGQRIAMDVSHGAFPGWECPNLGRIRETPVHPRSLQSRLLWPIVIGASLALYAVRRVRGRVN